MDRLQQQPQRKPTLSFVLHGANKAAVAFVTTYVFFCSDGGFVASVLYFLFLLVSLFMAGGAGWLKSFFAILVSSLSGLHDKGVILKEWPGL
jgi:hypothetical protein